MGSKPSPVLTSFSFRRGFWFSRAIFGTLQLWTAAIIMNNREMKQTFCIALCMRDCWSVYTPILPLYYLMPGKIHQFLSFKRYFIIIIIIIWKRELVLSILVKMRGIMTVHLAEIGAIALEHGVELVPGVFQRAKQLSGCSIRSTLTLPGLISLFLTLQWSRWDH